MPWFRISKRACVHIVILSMLFAYAQGAAMSVLPAHWFCTVETAKFDENSQSWRNLFLEKCVFTTSFEVGGRVSAKLSNIKYDDFAPQDILPYWMNESRIQEILPADTVVFVASGSGWPLRCVHYTAVLSVNDARVPSIEMSTSGGIRLHRLPSLSKQTVNEWYNVIDEIKYGRVMAIGPIWTGLFGNTLVYAMFVSTILIFWRILRISRRHRRGQCAQCGYALRCSRETGCPVDRKSVV